MLGFFGEILGFDMFVVFADERWEKSLFWLMGFFLEVFCIFDLLSSF